MSQRRYLFGFWLAVLTPFSGVTAQAAGLHKVQPAWCAPLRARYNHPGRHDREYFPGNPYL
jgi:hypothetical protein